MIEYVTYQISPSVLDKVLKQIKLEDYLLKKDVWQLNLQKPRNVIFKHLE